MVDVNARRMIADAIDSFLSGQIDNWALDDAMFKLRTDDDLCVQLRSQMWFLYDDVARYLNSGKRSLPSSAAAMLRRWVTLLRSTREWSGIVDEPPQSRFRRFIQSRLRPARKFTDNEYWPLGSAKEWEEITI
jgi:hypothetical protein